uniref:KIAA0586 n=1 Tax=Sphenodon punctatus TaxID=8508 RepID=A0A8D0HM77_SPHPU
SQQAQGLLPSESFSSCVPSQMPSSTTSCKDVLPSAPRSTFCIYRTQNAPVFKEVKVQLIEHLSPEQKDSSTRETRSPRSEIDSAATVAAATAAAIATTAPLLKVQSDLEAKVNCVSEMLNKLQETDKQLQRVVEQQNSIKAQQYERPPCQERVNELEKQRSAFMEQRIQHLEKLQQQQMTVLLEHILNSQETPLSQMGSSEHAPLTSTRMVRHSETDGRSDALQRESFPTFRSSIQAFNPIEKRVKKADAVLHDLGQLKREMRDILQVRRQKDIDIAPSVTEPHRASKPSILQTVKAPKSILKEAERILRGVQNNKKVLEENLEAIIRAKDGDAIYTFINSLTANRDALEAIRIRKTVDEWIETISMEIREEMLGNDFEQTKYDPKDQKPCWRIKRGQNIKDVKANKEMKTKSQKPQGALTKKPLPVARPFPRQPEDNVRMQSLRMYSDSLQKKGGNTEVMGGWGELVKNEEYLSQVYGKPLYQGHRSTLKKAPYLRFNSPSPKSKPQRPKVIECVRGTKVKSSRTQTSPYAPKVVTSPRKQSPHSVPPCQEHQYIFSPSRSAPAVSGPMEGHLIPMAIPLGQTQMNGISPQPATVIIGKPHPVTVTTSIPPVSPKPQPKVKKPSIAVIEMRSEKKDPPKLSLQVLPNVDINSITSDSTSLSLVSPAPPPPPKAWIQTPENTQHEEENIKFPGTNFIDVTDVMQDEEEDDGIPEFSELVLEFNRQAEVVSPKYNGPPFPPAAPIIERRETLENRLVSWVEQEVMARIISGMYPVQKEAVPDVSSSESQESETVTSDIVETAGGGGFQLFVNAGVPVNSEVISHFVNEALAETIAVMLGDREGQRAVPSTNIPPHTTVLPETLVPTPLATPQSTPPQSPTPLKEPSPVKTPGSSPSITETDGDVGEQQMAATGNKSDSDASPVGTPVATPVATPPRVATPSPPASERASDKEKTESPKPPNPWEDAELPLEEEKPSPSSEGLHERAVVMSVAKDEEAENLILPTSSEPARPLKSLPQEQRIPSPVHTPSSGPSTQESSLTVTETDTENADRPISEGEVLFSYGQVVAAREGGLCLPNLSDSLTSTLHDAHDMVRKLNLFYYPLILLLHFLEGQRPRLTRAAESILTGHSFYLDQPTAQASMQRSWRVPSPGQFDRSADADLSPGPMSVAELESQPARVNDRASSHSEDLSQVNCEPLFCISWETVPHVSSLAPPAKMLVMLPSMNPEDHTPSISTIHGSSDSSGTDTF